MKLSSDFSTGSGKRIRQLHQAHYALEMRRDKRVYENYFHFRVDAEEDEGEVFVDIHPDQDFLPESRRILDTHFAPATLWVSAKGPFTQDISAWRPHRPHLVEWHRDFIRVGLWLEPNSVTYVSSHHPLTPESWVEMIRGRAADRPDVCCYRSIGSTPEGREIGCLTIGTASERVMLIAGEHPAETAGSYAIWGIADYLLSVLPEAKALLDHYRFDCLPVANPDGLARGNCCFTSTGVDLIHAFGAASEGRFDSPEARATWEQAASTPLALLIDFHAYSGGGHHQDPPGEALIMLSESAQNRLLPPAAARVHRAIRDRIMFGTDAGSSRYHPLDLAGEPESLCYRVAAHLGAPGVLYELNGGLSGPYRNSRNGIGVLQAAMRGLIES